MLMQDVAVLMSVAILSADKLLERDKSRHRAGGGEGESEVQVDHEDEEEFSCPLFVDNDFPEGCLPLPTPLLSSSSSSALSLQLHSRLQHKHSTSGEGGGSGWPVLRVSVPTIEDGEDCRCFSVRLVSAPRWLRPTELLL